MEDVEFAEFTLELCDERPSDVEREGPRFGGGRSVRGQRASFGSMNDECAGGASLNERRPPEYPTI
jgi:hypothetical protein